MAQPQLKPGDRLLYVPHLDFWNDPGPDGKHLFDFVHHKRQGGTHQAGDAVDPLHYPRIPSADGRPRLWAGPLQKHEGTYVATTAHGAHELRVGRPRHFWEGVVREEVVKTPRRVVAMVEGKEQEVVVFDETRRLVLDCVHPGKRWETHHFPLEGTPNDVKHDPAKGLHTYHFPGE